MRAYVESNFVLEIVLEQEQHEACLALVELAEAGRIELVLPAFSLMEPLMTLHRRRREQEELTKAIEKRLQQIARTRSLSAAATTNDVTELLSISTQTAERRYDDIRARLTTIAAVLPLTDGTMRAAEKLSTRYKLQLPDAVVLAAVLNDLRRGGLESSFLNRNTRDFGEPALVRLLEQRGCKMFGSFDAGLTYMRSRLAAPPA